jgi:hypothetical protein
MAHGSFREARRGTERPGRQQRGCRHRLVLAAGSVLFLLLTHGTAGAQDLTGYLKNFSIGYRLPDGFSGGDSLWQISNRARLKYSHRLNAAWKVDAAWELAPRFQSTALFAAGPYGFVLDPSVYRVADPDARVYPAAGQTPDHFGLYQNLDRLNFTWSTRRADVIVGRQAIAWGSARVVNPTDIIAPFAFNDLDKEEVFGVDAVRLRIPTGPLSEVDLGYLPGRHMHFDESVFFARRRSSIAGADATFLLMGFRDHLLFGMDLSRSLWQMGFNLEAAYVDTGVFNPAAAGRDYFRLSVGLDDSLTDRLYAFVEYHFSSAGAGDPRDYGCLFRQPAYRDGSVYLLGRHYLSLGGTVQVTPLNRLAFLGIGNLQDRSASLGPNWEYNMTTNSYLTIGANLCFGRSPATAPAAGSALQERFRSEFGSYPDMVYVSYRFYF